MVVKLSFLVMFVLVMLGVGLYSRRYIKDVSDFFLGGKKMGAWITAFAYGTSYFSAVIFIGYAGKIGWGFGVSSVWIGITNAVFGCFLAWKILGKKTRTMTHTLNVQTMPEFFEARYQSKSMKVISAFVIFLFLVPYTASVYKGLGYLFESSFNIGFKWVVLGMAVLTGVYLMLGGYVATAINDLIQGVIMLIGVIVMVLLVVNNDAVGGLSQGLAKLNEFAPDAKLTSITGPKPWDLFCLVFMTSFGAWGLPQMVHKFYAIKNEQAIKNGTVISTVFALVIGVGAYLTGAFGRLFMDNKMPVDSISGNANPDMIIPIMLDKALPDAMMGIIIILVLSASMSTLASLVLVSSSAISIDFIKGFINPKISNKTSMFIMRVLCGLFIAFSYFIAIKPNATIVALMSLSWGVISGMFLGPFLFGLWWKGTTRIGSWSGFIAGAAVMIWGLASVNFDLAKLNVPQYATIAMIASVIIVPVVSMFTKKYESSHLDRVFAENTENV